MSTRCALISTYDKTGLDELTAALTKNHYEVISTGGTASYLAAQGFKVREVSDLTGFPAMMDGRVKTLHPYIFGGILARREVTSDLEELKKYNVPVIDLVVVNLYPFLKVIEQPGVTLETALENIDIGGVSLLRAAAKNFPHCLVLSSPTQYGEFINRLGDGELDSTYRRKLAVSAFSLTTGYDRAIASWLRGGPEMDEDSYAPFFKKTFTLRYGENPHQKAALFLPIGEPPTGIPAARKLAGKEISYNNYLDLEAAWKLCREFNQPAAVIVKHCNPCGVAVGSNITECFTRARLADAMSAYGGIIALNRPVDIPTAEEILAKGTFFECIIAPSYSPEALVELSSRKSWSERFIIMDMPDFAVEPPGFEPRALVGGMLVQTTDLTVWEKDQLQIVSQKAPSREMLAEMKFAFTVAKHVRSNAIVITRDGVTLGIGAGQPNRVWSMERALANAGDAARGAILASDGFFPMPDAPELAINAGIAGIVQPGGSKNDDKVIEAVNRAGIVMMFAGQRHFRH